MHHGEPQSLAHAHTHTPHPAYTYAQGDLLLETQLLFPSNLTLQQKLLLKGALFLPAKLDDVQVRPA